MKRSDKEKEKNMRMLKAVYSHSIHHRSKEAETAMKNAKKTFDSMRELRLQLLEAYESIIDNKAN